MMRDRPILEALKRVTVAGIPRALASACDIDILGIALHDGWRADKIFLRNRFYE